MNTFPQLLTIREASVILKLTPITIYAYIRKGKLSAVKFGRYYRISHDDLAAFIDRHKTEAYA